VTRVRATIVLLALLAAWIGGSAQAVQRRVRLTPPESAVTFRAYGMGLLPVDASFTVFDGWLTYDPDDRPSCRVELRVQTASLTTADLSVLSTIAGPDFLDVGSFPTLDYTGTCQADGLGGMLAMHGVTRPFALSLDWTANGVVAEGRLVRADWGMTARPLLGGRTVRIRVAVPLGSAPQQGSHPASVP
jgi:polyisoprenoid-binding protein YceI